MWSNVQWILASNNIIYQKWKVRNVAERFDTVYERGKKTAYAAVVLVFIRTLTNQFLGMFLFRLTLTHGAIVDKKKKNKIFRISMKMIALVKYEILLHFSVSLSLLHCIRPQRNAIVEKTVATAKLTRIFSYFLRFFFFFFIFFLYILNMRNNNDNKSISF